jgi:hypothetical protein
VHNLIFALCFGLCFWFGLFFGFFELLVVIAARFFNMVVGQKVIGCWNGYVETRWLLQESKVDI